MNRGGHNPGSVIVDGTKVRAQIPRVADEISGKTEKRCEEERIKNGLPLADLRMRPMKFFSLNIE
jgi:hypothetical protein